MIKVNKNILEFLEIKSIYIQDKNSKKLLICIPLEINNDLFLLVLSDSVKDEQYTVKILTENNSFIEVLCVLKRLDATSNRYIAFLQDKLPSNLAIKLEQLKSDNQFLERRSGQRFFINEENYKSLGLKSRKCYLVINAVEIPCYLQDISVHGMRISFSLNSNMQKIFLKDDFRTLMLSLLGIKLFFTNPLTSIFLILLPTRIDSYDVHTNIISLGCKIKEPCNIEYSKKIIDFVNKIEVNYVLEQSR